MALHKLCELEALPDGGSARLPFPGDSFGHGLCVVRQGAQVRAYLNRCPHTGGPLDWVEGQFLVEDGRYLQCATHGARFRVGDGYCVSGPCSGATLRAVSLRVDDVGSVLFEEADAAVKAVQIV